LRSSSSSSSSNNNNNNNNDKDYVITWGSQTNPEKATLGRHCLDYTHNGEGGEVAAVSWRWCSGTTPCTQRVPYTSGFQPAGCTLPAARVREGNIPPFILSEQFIKIIDDITEQATMFAIVSYWGFK
jgi:hypothetical protein